MHYYGGVYADLDMYCTRSMDALLAAEVEAVRQPVSIVVGSMGTDPNWEHCVPNAWMMSVPRHEFWIMLLKSIMDRAENQPDLPAEHATGPSMLKVSLETFIGSRLAEYNYSDDVVKGVRVLPKVRVCEGGALQRMAQLILGLHASPAYRGFSMTAGCNLPL